MKEAVIHEAMQIMQRLQDEGHRAYIVGGAVRDELLGRASSDIDITTSAKPDAICFLFPKAHRMHTEHETVLVRSAGCSIEVTTEKGNSLIEDLKKRDFTINALAKSVNGEVIDPLGGRQDLDLQLIRSLHPFARMSEDPLRMLRAIRFASELDFTLDAELFKVISEIGSSIKGVAAERIMVEWEKLLRGKALTHALTYLLESDLYLHIPRLELTSGEMKQLQALPAYNQSDTAVFVWFLHMVWIGRTDEKYLQKLVLSNEMKRQLKQRLRLYLWRKQHELTDWQLYQYGLSATADVEKSRQRLKLSHTEQHILQKQWQGLPIQSREQLPITGHDIIQSANKSAGPWVKSELEWLELQVINREVQPLKQDLLTSLERKRQNEE